MTAGNTQASARGKKVASDVFRRIGEEFRSGIVSVREIAERYGVKEETINRWARKFGWKRDLTKRVQARATERLSGVGDVPEGETGQVDLEKAVERAADTQVAIVEGHRQRSKVLYRIFDRLSVFLSAYMDPGITDEELKKVAPRPVMTSTESVGHTLHTLATVHSKLVAIERQAYNIDSGVQEKSYEERLKELLDSGELG